MCQSCRFSRSVVHLLNGLLELHVIHFARVHDGDGVALCAGTSIAGIVGIMRATITTVAMVGSSWLWACGEPPPTHEQTAALSMVGSHFEIDDDANLVVDQPGALDWASVDDTKVADEPSGQGDNSYKGGAKEDDACPGTSTGSIPNNKSDLKTFGVYQEPGSEAGDPGFLHLFWSRVQDPSGTTLMDFEFNQSSEDCGNGVNPVRSAGDLLLEYRLEQGGATATIMARFWDGSEWGAETDLTALNAATGTINSSAIAEGDSDGIGALDPRTFGEASIDLDFIFDEGRCMSFGSAFVKSRSSDAFNSALKDFVGPASINITNCGQVIIRKETEPPGWGSSYGYTHNLQTDPESGTSFGLADGQAETFSNVLFGNAYTVTEDPVGPDMELTNIDCSASVGVDVTVDVANRTITFDIDADTDVVDCTFTNRAKGTIVIEKMSTDTTGTFSFTSSTLQAFQLSTTATGEAGLASRTFAELDPGTYDVAETVPAYWTLVSATCSDGSDPASIQLGAGETVTCRFTNERMRGALRIVKQRSHAAYGPGPHPHPGVSFLVSGGEIAVPIPLVTDENGVTCIDNLPLSALVGNYSVTEVVPAGYVPADSLTKTAPVVTAGLSCPQGDEVDFANIPLTNITVSVDSQIPGGTLSTITCGSVGPIPTDATGDGSLTLPNLVHGTYSCTVVVSP